MRDSIWDKRASEIHAHARDLDDTQRARSADQFLLPFVLIDSCHVRIVKGKKDKAT